MQAKIFKYFKYLNKHTHPISSVLWKTLPDVDATTTLLIVLKSRKTSKIHEKLAKPQHVYSKELNTENKTTRSTDSNKFYYKKQGKGNVWYHTVNIKNIKRKLHVIRDIHFKHKTCTIKNKEPRLECLSWSEHHPINQMVAGSIPGQGACSSLTSMFFSRGLFQGIKKKSSGED